MQKTIIDLQTKQATVVDFTQEEIAEMELQVFEQVQQPSSDELAEAEYEMKLITKLMEWGIL